jgi:hypothetical protein
MVAPGMWDGKVRYGRLEKQPPTGQHTFSFNSVGGTQHITQGIATIGAYAAKGAGPDFGGAIGVTHDSAKGVDITIPVYQFSETHYLPASVVTDAYKGTLFYLADPAGRQAAHSGPGLQRRIPLIRHRLGQEIGNRRRLAPGAMFGLGTLNHRLQPPLRP